jgi:hypothetical protein
VDTIEHEGVKITDDTQKANILNNFFASVLTEEPIDDTSLPKVGKGTKSSLFDFDISATDVRKKLLKLKKNKACGTDGIHVNVLKEVLNFDVPLADIFTYSLRSSSVPQDWRDANITPLHKKGSRMKSNNYRPVSLTSQVVKLMERLVLDALWTHILDNDLITCDQHGFQGSCSCVTQLIECLSDWVHAYDAGLETDAIYLDFSKAFDTVAHKRLIHKLNNLGIKGNVLSWIEAFLLGRRQRVVLRNGVSGWKDVTSGVPQGSILGPVLFLLYVNDLPDCVASTAKLFADDTKLYRIIRDEKDCQSLQDDMNALAAWSRIWLLRFNADKCVVLRIRAAMNYAYTLNGTYLMTEKDQRDLGVIVSDTLTPGKHITSVTKKAKQRLGMIRRCFTGLNSDKVRILYTTLVRPVLEYGSTVWNPWLKKDINALDKVQRQCERMCSEEIKFESLADRRMRTDLTEVYKYVNHKYKCDPDQLFSYPSRQMRGHSMKLFKPGARTEVCKNFFTHRVIDSWNRLPEKVVAAPSVESFKKRLRALPFGEEG